MVVTSEAYRISQYFSSNIVTDRVRKKDNAIGCVRLFVRLFRLHLLNRLAFELEFLYVK